MKGSPEVDPSSQNETVSIGPRSSVIGTLPPTEPRYVVRPFPRLYEPMEQLFRNELNMAIIRNAICFRIT